MLAIPCRQSTVKYFSNTREKQMQMEKINIALADDHQLFLKSLSMMVSSFANCNVVAEAANGKLLLQKIEALPSPPDIVLLDVVMPEMNGPATAAYIEEHYPTIKIIAISMNDDEISILKMIRNGACSYLFKDTNPEVLEHAINEVHQKGYFNADAFLTNYSKLMKYEKSLESAKPSPREQQLLELSASDLTYAQIAKQMGLSEYTVDGHRKALFEKLNVQSRTGMVLEAMRRKLITLK